MNELYRTLGITKQGVWDHFRREQAELELIARLIGRVDEHRKGHPGAGLRKMYEHMAPQGIGRDKFCRIFKQLGYGVRRRSNPIRTTIPAHKVFDNLIEGRLIDGPAQVWQSDITYVKVGSRHYYLTFIIDVYTRRIVGYAVSDSLRAEANIRALRMALALYDEQTLNGLVHHSDRGSQYTDSRYLRLLRSHGVTISMGRKAQDNAYAERVNGVIKNEYLIYRNLSGLKDLKTSTRQAIDNYNRHRHHGALGRQSPMDFEMAWEKLDCNDRAVQVIRSGNTPENLEASLPDKAIDTTREYPYCTINLN